MSVNLSKGQKISLKKEAGEHLSNVTMGLGWDEKKAKGLWGMLTGGGESIDLDASCVLFDASKTLLEGVYYGQLKSNDGSIKHSGDNLTGAGEGDDEQILVNLDAVPAHVTYLVFTITSFKGQTFDKIENAFCRLVNQANGKEIARYNLSGGGNNTAQIMVKLYRHEGEWKMHAIGEGANGQTYKEIISSIKPHL